MGLYGTLRSHRLALAISAHMGCQRRKRVLETISKGFAQGRPSGSVAPQIQSPTPLLLEPRSIKNGGDIDQTSSRRRGAACDRSISEV
jgi:hypothetical protein